METETRLAEIEGIGQIALNARDVERAKGFYRDVLGMRHLFDIPGQSFFDCGGVRLMIGRAETPEVDHPASVLYYRVDDLRESHRRLAAAGADLLGEPHLIARMPDHELWMTFCRDSEGNLLGLMEERR